MAEAVALDTTSTLRVPGALRARQRAELAFLHAGYLADRRVELGDRVAAGDVLAVLHNPTLQPGVASAAARVDEARTRLEQLETDTRRQATLVERNLISDDQLDQTRTGRDAARAALEQAEAALAEARGQLDEASLRAPFAGTVARFMVEPGDFVAAGRPVMALLGAGGNEAALGDDAAVPGDDAAVLDAEIRLPPEIAIDSIASVRLVRQYDGVSVPAFVAQAGEAEPGRPRPVIVRMAPSESVRWRSGDAVYSEFEVAQHAMVGVPLAALVDPGTGIARVFRVVEGRVERVSVASGRLHGDRVGVIGDIRPGDRIVVEGQAHLLDGEAVRVIE
ncbi:MAG: efflux RND transporter periplasmic adaptor subunit [Wenzhouxiangellaceae bacterium]|nr:efflux RND transporter periplasmic adaptor subunit [Wenzhouxiangellaceae bacterium]